MNEFKVLNDRKRKPYTKVISVIFGVLLILLGILIDSIFGFIAGPLLIWSAFFVKYTVVNEEGIAVNYNAKLFNYKEEWLFNDITNLHREKVKDPEYAALHFTKGAMSKRLIFTSKDSDIIINLALRKNDKIYFDEAY